MSIESGLMKYILVIATWAVLVGAFVPDVNVAGWSDFTARLSTDPFATLPPIPSFSTDPLGAAGTAITSGFSLLYWFLGALVSFAGLLWGATTFGLETDAGAVIVIDPFVAQFLLALGVVFWILTLVIILRMFRGQ